MEKMSGIEKQNFRIEKHLTVDEKIAAGWVREGLFIKHPRLDVTEFVGRPIPQYSNSLFTYLRDLSKYIVCYMRWKKAFGEQKFSWEASCICLAEAQRRIPTPNEFASIFYTYGSWKDRVAELNLIPFGSNYFSFWSADGAHITGGIADWYCDRFNRPKTASLRCLKE